MKRLILVVAALAALASPALAEEPSPRDVVVEIYHIAAGPKGDYQTPTAFDDKQVRKHFTKSLLAAQKAMDLRSKKLNEPILDFDPVTNSQDPSVRNLSVDVESADAARTIVAASFDSEGAKARNVVRYVFMREGAAWKLDDIRGDNGEDKWDLREIMNHEAAAK
ncbi:DUF3828 domain-containing protein [Methylocapsa sp. S129]|uniref:DUF3828 domain-containing protein n=1 Tax=Methylocapsa sp. S129 TaxID=1641869 RepID=UPI00131E1FEC|nr:DUF3828 domain-containing protein [Methylocapsa sp. S129]